MSAQSNPAVVPEELSSPRAKLVYLYLAVADGATVVELQSALSMTKLSLFGVLRTLERRGLVGKNRGRYVVSSCSAASGPL